MTGRHVVGGGEPNTAEPEQPEPDPDIAVEPPQHPGPPEQYVEPVEEHEHTGTGPVQWVESDVP